MKHCAVSRIDPCDTSPPSHTVESAAIECSWRRPTCGASHLPSPTSDTLASGHVSPSPSPSALQTCCCVKSCCAADRMLWRAVCIPRVCHIWSSITARTLRSLLLRHLSSPNPHLRFLALPVRLTCMMTTAAKKRKDAPTGPTKGTSPAKRARPEVPEYHLTPSVKDEDGEIQWPAPKAQIQRAREIIVER